MADLKLKWPGRDGDEVIVSGIPSGTKVSVTYLTRTETRVGSNGTGTAKPSNARSEAQRRRWAEQKRKQREAAAKKAAKKAETK